MSVSLPGHLPLHDLAETRMCAWGDERGEPLAPAGYGPSRRRPGDKPISPADTPRCSHMRLGRSLGSWTALRRMVSEWRRPEGRPPGFPVLSRGPPVRCCAPRLHGPGDAPPAGLDGAVQGAPLQVGHQGGGWAALRTADPLGRIRLMLMTGERRRRPPPTANPSPRRRGETSPGLRGGDRPSQGDGTARPDHRLRDMPPLGAAMLRGDGARTARCGCRHLRERGTSR